MTEQENWDTSREVYHKALKRGNLIGPDYQDILGNRPYLVIGDFAYILGEDGSIWMTPVKTDNAWIRGKGDVKVILIEWDRAVDVTWFGLNLCKGHKSLETLLPDLMRVTDNMRDSGVKVGIVR